MSIPLAVLKRTEMNLHPILSSTRYMYVDTACGIETGEVLDDLTNNRGGYMYVDTACGIETPCFQNLLS